MLHSEKIWSCQKLNLWLLLEDSLVWGKLGSPSTTSCDSIPLLMSILSHLPFLLVEMQQWTLFPRRKGARMGEPIPPIIALFYAPLGWQSRSRCGAQHQTLRVEQCEAGWLRWRSAFAFSERWVESDDTISFVFEASRWHGRVPCHEFCPPTFQRLGCNAVDCAVLQGKKGTKTGPRRSRLYLRTNVVKPLRIGG